MKKQQNIQYISRCLAVAALGIGLLYGVAGCKDKQDPSYSGTPMTSEMPKGTADYQNLTKQAYRLKKDGHNGEAMKFFEEAIKLAEPDSTLYASALDDQASILTRMGKYDEARKKYTAAKTTLEKNHSASPLLRGVIERIELLDQLESRHITCAEPATPDNADNLPYYPNVSEFQQALGKLTRDVASCHNSNVIKPMSTRMIITGDGKLIHAFARGGFAGSEEEKCVVSKLQSLIPTIDLPRFAACFRGFTYPFMLGNHPPAEPSPAKDITADGDNDNDSVQIPPQNAAQGDMPAKDAALAGAQKLMQAYMTGNADDAMAFFFPADAFKSVKDSPNPDRYHQKLVQWFKEDIALEQSRFQNEKWQVDDISLGNCTWKAPGSEANKVGYWSCTRNTVSVSSGEKKRRFEIQVLINWGTDWYITHLRPIRK